jgi:outer membrane protein OmpA-like peptidoglycan-associated protein
MESKKYSLFIGILCLFASASYAQVGTAYDVLDSSLISTKKLPQFNEFRNNAYPFPPKPRNQWEIGVKGGLVTINGDVPSIFPTGGFGVHVRKALGYVVSLRLEYMYGVGKGLAWKPRTGGFSRPFSNGGYTPGGAPIYDNYKTTVQDLSLESIFTLNNINFNKGKTNVVFYALAGVGATLYDAKVDALSGTNTRYNFASIAGGNYDNRKDTRDALENILDEKYESEGERPNESELFGSALSPSVSVGLGVAFRLGKRVNLAIEDRLISPFTDLLDGQRYQNARGMNNGNILSPNKDNINYFTVGLNFNLGSRSTEPLWWMNPLDYAYNELNAPKHMKFPKPILDDADADGITDQFDQEPNTPANAPVDSHGVSRDTDGDGVPDYKDKELVTPTQCQPVDADGVGKCPDPACCTTLDSLIKAGGIRPACNLGSLPSISFRGRSSALSNDARAVLTGVAETLRNSPACKISVIGYGESSKSAQQTSWDRVNAVINHLVEKEGISADRFIFKYGEAGGDVNTVDLRDGSNEEGPNTVPAPHPNLRRR